MSSSDGCCAATSPNTQQSSAVYCMSQIRSYPLYSVGGYFERAVDVIHSDPNNFSTLPENKITIKVLNAWGQLLSELQVQHCDI